MTPSTPGRRSALHHTAAALLLVFTAGVYADEHEEVEERELVEEIEEVYEAEMEEEEEHILEEMEEKADEVFGEGVRVFLEESLPAAIELLETLGEHAEALERGEPMFHYLERKIDLGMTARHLMEMRERDEPFFDTALEHEHLAIETEMLGMQYRKAGPEARGEIETELRTLLEEGFEASQRMRQAEAKHIEEELQRIRSLLEMREKNKATIIQRRMYEVLHGEDPYAW